MYCINCGVELADTEKRCPLCGTLVYHPELSQPAADPLYPAKEKKAARSAFRWYQIPFTMGILLVLVGILLLCDLQTHRRLTWSGYAIGALLVGYVAVILPGWFEKPNPVIFVPCGFTAALGYLFYINFTIGGNWFWTLALPLVGGIALIVETVVTIARYVRRGRLFLYGGAALALGGLSLLAEFLVNFTFGIAGFFGWSLYPLIALALLGLVLIFLGICRPAREAMAQKFFI